MELGVHLADFTWPDGPQRLGADLATVATAAEEAGFATLDVVSGGRVWLSIGAAWNEDEARGLGLPFPPTAERFERLEEALQICLQMWADDDGPYSGQHYQLERTLSSPQPLSRPHPPILVGGGGEEGDALPCRAVCAGLQPLPQA
ncbi:MAG TPA: LLM class flavin-dependent oxidoreductase [Streptosporangiaceae bacterium]|nr:LLM class flavin-dependent oxidoreductase [Streptosporangiaceae bacterium]